MFGGNAGKGKKMNTNELLEVAQHLYGLLDDIDTASDAAKTDDAHYRRMVEKIQAKKSAVVAECDGYTVKLRPVAYALPYQDAADVYLVLDEAGAPIHCASTSIECHDHINDAISNHDIDGAVEWVVRRAQLLPMDLTPNDEAHRRDASAVCSPSGGADCSAA